ncbi:MAG TPA: hypothetical protein VIL72_04275 [Beijerinckiaceae bacterium]|jgi:hypothetical protein
MDRSARIRAYLSHRALGSQTFIGLSFALFVFASVMSMMTAAQPRRGFEDTSLSACASFQTLPVFNNARPQGDPEGCFDAIAADAFVPEAGGVAVGGLPFGYDRRAPALAHFEARGPPAPRAGRSAA